MHVQLSRFAALQLPFFQLKFEDFRVADEKKEKVRSLEDEAWIWAPGVFQVMSPRRPLKISFG